MSLFALLFSSWPAMGTVIPLGLVGGRRAGCPFVRLQTRSSSEPLALLASGSPGDREVDRGLGGRVGQRESWEVACNAKASRKTSRSTRRRRRHCCELALPALLRPLPATAQRLNMNIARAGSFPGAVNTLPISYKYFCCCPLARGRLRGCSPLRPSSTALRSAGRGWQGQAGAGRGWQDLAGVSEYLALQGGVRPQGKHLLWHFPTYCIRWFHFRTSRFLVRCAVVLKLLTI